MMFSSLVDLDFRLLLQLSDSRCVMAVLGLCMFLSEVVGCHDDTGGVM